MDLPSAGSEIPHESSRACLEAKQDAGTTEGGQTEKRESVEGKTKDEDEGEKEKDRKEDSRRDLLCCGSEGCCRHEVAGEEPQASSVGGPIPGCTDTGMESEEKKKKGGVQRKDLRSQPSSDGFQLGRKNTSLLKDSSSPSLTDRSAAAYASLVRRGCPDFVEVKAVTYAGTSKHSKGITMRNIPWHHQVRAPPISLSLSFSFSQSAFLSASSCCLSLYVSPTILFFCVAKDVCT